jgi:hypothetical protein
MRKPDKAIFEALSDEQLLGLCIEREAGGEPLDGKIAVGTVVLERVEHRKWDGNTIHEVILMPWQFSWTMPEAGREYYEEAVKIAANWDEEYKKRTSLQVCFGIAVGMLNGETPRDPDLAAVHCCQYLAVTAKNTVNWWKAMKFIKKIGGHEFYAEP